MLYLADLNRAPLTPGPVDRLNQLHQLASLLRWFAKRPPLDDYPWLNTHKKVTRI